MTASGDSGTRRATSAYGLSMIGRLARALGRLAAFFLVARLFPLADAGHFAYYLAAGGLVALISGFGLPEYLLRELPTAGDRAASLLRRAARVRLAALLPAALIAWLLLVALDRTTPIAALGTLVFAVVLDAADLLAAVRRAQGRYEREALESGLPLVAVGLAAAAGALGASFAVFQLVLGGGALALMAVRLGLLCGGREEPGAAGLGAIVWASRWFMVKGLLAWALIESPVVVLEHLATPVDVAMFAGAMRAVGFLTQPFQVLNQILLPSLALHRAESRTRLASSALRLNLISLCFLPAGFGGGVVLGHLLLRSFGGAYLEAEPVLVLLALVHAMNMALVSPTALVATGRERAISLVMVAALIVLYGGLALQVASLTALDAALATLVSLGISKLGYAALYRAEGLPLADRRLLVAAAAVVAWLGALAVLPSPGREIGLVAGAAVSALATLRLLRATRVFASRAGVLRSPP